MQSQRDCERILTLGAERTRVRNSGNTKFDELEARVPEAVKRQLLLEFQFTPDHLIFLAGSTHPGEEAILLESYWRARVSLPNLRLVIAPRQPQRAAEVEALILAKGFRCQRRSRMERGLTLDEVLKRISGGQDDPDRVVLVDTLGELATLYSLCQVAFVGKSLVPGGGQNLLQPLSEGKPTLIGPYMSNFASVAEMALEAKVAFQVRNAEEISERIVSLCSSPERLAELEQRALAFIAENRGASRRCASLVLQALARRTAAR